MKTDKFRNMLEGGASDVSSYLNLGLTLAAAFSWVEAGKDVASRFKYADGPILQALFMTILAIVVVRITETLNSK